MKWLGDIREHVSKLPILAGAYPFQFFLVLVGLGALISLLLFLVPFRQEAAQESAIRFREQSFQQILQIWGAREQAFLTIPQELTRNPFRTQLTEE